MEGGRATVIQAPSSEQLLRIWEESAGSHPIRRALALLDAVWPETDVGRWARAPIGTRDGWLLTLHESLFGPQLETVTACPQCGESLESSFTTRDVGGRTPGAPREVRALPAARRGLRRRVPPPDE